MVTEAPAVRSVIRQVCDLLSARFLSPLTAFYEGTRQFVLFRLTNISQRLIGQRNHAHQLDPHASNGTLKLHSRRNHFMPKLPCMRDAPLCQIRGRSGKPVDLPSGDRLPGLASGLARQQELMRAEVCAPSAAASPEETSDHR